jgi:predicted permease
VTHSPSSSRLGHPPRLARWILERALPKDVRDDVSGDLLEMFHRRQRSSSRVEAWRWYWAQSAAFTLHFLAERVRQRRSRADMSTGMSWIDLKLALRMLLRSPGLTIVGVLGMAVGIAIAAAAFTIGGELLDSSLPFAEGDRIVAIQQWDVQTQNREQRVVYDYASWRNALQSVEDVSAFTIVGRNLISADAQPETVSVVQMSASGFRVTQVAPLLGRYLMPDDERADAPDVAVIGEDVWRRRFASDPQMLGRQLKLGSTSYTIVGVMPAGFAFPVNDRYWIPLRNLPSYEPRTGPTLYVFGRLAPGATLDSAQAELSALGQQATVASPSTHEHLRPRITPYTHAFTDMDAPDNALALRLTQTLIVMLLVLISVNVAILVYARTATRHGEIAVRTALGASRRRIVVQLSLEALVLASVAAIAGLGLVSIALHQLDAALVQLGLQFPFWLKFKLTTLTGVSVIGLTVLAAAIVGVVPALKATGRRVQSGLQGLSAGGGSKMQMGRVWTVLIVAQVAIAVALLPATMYHSWNSLRSRTAGRGSAAFEFLTAAVVMDRATDVAPTDANERDFRNRFGIQQVELERLVEADPAVASVTFSMTNPGEELALVLEAEGVPVPGGPVDYNIVEGSKRGHLVRFNRVAADYFATYEVPVLMGRTFDAGDAAQGSDTILVDRLFVERIFGGENPLGRRVRYVGRSREADARNVVLDRWYEIVGVVTDFPPHATYNEASAPRVYHAVTPGNVHPALMAVRVRGGAPSTFTDRLRTIGAAVDPGLQLRHISSAEEVIAREQGVMRVIGVTLVVVTLSVVVLSAAGIYALMSFTVARRRKEIGIRAALGANPARLLGGIFKRTFAQLAVGVALGMLGAIAIEGGLEGEMFQGHGATILPLVALFITVVGLLAALGPARRGLQIQPTEALRED